MAIQGKSKNCICKDTNYLTLNNKKNLETYFYVVEVVKLASETNIAEIINLFFEITFGFLKLVFNFERGLFNINYVIKLC